MIKRCPIALRDGRIADVELERFDEAKTVRLILPKRAASVNPFTGEVSWSRIRLDHVFLPEDFFSDKILG